MEIMSPPQKNMNQYIRKTFIITICLLVGWLPFAAAERLGPYRCLKTDTPVVADGKLDEPIWQEAEPIHFRTIATGDEPALESEVKIAWDDKYLYAAMTCKDPNVWATVELPATISSFGGTVPLRREYEIMLWDCFVEFFFDPDADGKNYLEFHINPYNSILDAYIVSGYDMLNRFVVAPRVHWEWNCFGLLHGVKIDGSLNDFTDTDKGWSVEIAIPWQDINTFIRGNCPPRDGDIWKAHLARVWRKGPASERQYWTWPVMGLVKCHIPEKWETIQFSDGSQKLPENKICRIGWAVTEKDIAALVRKANELGFNIIISHGSNEYLNQLCAEAQKYDIDIFCWFHITTPKGMEKYSQVVNESEKKISERIKHDKTPGKHKCQFGGEPVNPEEVHIGELLCFHRPEVIAYSKDKLKKVIENCPQLKGVAFDFIGYKNYRCCRCPASRRLFEVYYNKLIKPRNIMSREKALEQFSLDTMVDFNNRLAEYIQGLKPGMKTATHIYPTFLAAPVYGNRLDIDYCCQTVAWYFEPFWDLKKVAAYTNKVIKDEKRYFPRPKGIPFVGICMDNPGMNKPPERFRKELKTIREQGCRSFSICPFNIFLKHPELGKIVIEELDKDSGGKTN